MELKDNREIVKSSANPFASSVTKHIQDSNLPASVKEVLINKALFEHQGDLISLGEIMDLPPIERTVVPMRPPTPRKVVEVKLDIFEQFIKDWFGVIPTTRLHNQVYKVLRALPQLNIMNFKTLTRQRVVELDGVGDNTWRYIQYLQEELK